MVARGMRLPARIASSARRAEAGRRWLLHAPAWHRTVAVHGWRRRVRWQARPSRFRRKKSGSTAPVTAADSSRSLPPRTAGLHSGQDVLTVPDMRSKILCQCAGFGVGYLPVNLVPAELKTRQLVVKQVLNPNPAHNCSSPGAPPIAARRLSGSSAVLKTRNFLSAFSPEPEGASLERPVSFVDTRRLTWVK